MSSFTARVVDPHASAQQAVGHLFGNQAALPHDFDTFTALQVHDHFLQHGVECTLDFAAQLQRDFAADKLKNGELSPRIDTNGKQAETAVDGNNGSNVHQGSLGQTNPAPAKTFDSLPLASNPPSLEERARWIEVIDPLLKYAGRPGDWGRESKLGILTARLMHVRSELLDASTLPREGGAA